MSATAAWVRRQRDRPVAERERRMVLTVVAAVVVVVALLLALTTPGEPPISSSARPSAVKHPRRGQSAAGAGALTRESVGAAGTFLDGYLRYLYGRARAGEVRGATVAFADSLTRRASRVPPAMQGRHARVVSLDAESAPAGLIGVTALVNDGGLIDYAIVLLLAHQGHGLLVAGLAGA
jgi:hypothetical protein